MLSAEQARSIMKNHGSRYRNRKISKMMRKISRKVTKAAKEGYSGVWLSWGDFTFRQDLQRDLQEQLEAKGFMAEHKNAREFLVDWKEEED